MKKFAANNYGWQEGARVVGESIVNGSARRINVEHALHVLEIIEAATNLLTQVKELSWNQRSKWPMV